MQNRLLKTLSLALLMLGIVACGGGNGGKGRGQHGNGGASDIVVDEAIAAPKSILTPAIQDSISYMYSEEKMAKEVYLNVYAVQSVKQLNNIANNSEVKHIDAVDRLAQKYDLNISKYPETTPPYDLISLNSYGNGEFPVDHIQELYDLLYDKGIQSEQDALEVGCIIEVTDIDDLDVEISLAQTADASDVVTIFNFLRDGSYNHYWSFDKGLKNRGIETGCCSLGEAYCHPEYPQD